MQYRPKLCFMSLFLWTCFKIMFPAKQSIRTSRFLMTLKFVVNQVCYLQISSHNQILTAGRTVNHGVRFTGHTKARLAGARLVESCCKCKVINERIN